MCFQSLNIDKNKLNFGLNMSKMSLFVIGNKIYNEKGKIVVYNLFI